VKRGQDNSYTRETGVNPRLFESASKKRRERKEGRKPGVLREISSPSIAGGVQGVSKAAGRQCRPSNTLHLRKPRQQKGKVGGGKMLGICQSAVSRECEIR